MSDWQEASLADLAYYINGRAIKPEECSIQEGIPVIRIKQINDPQSIEDRFCGDDLEEKNIARSGDLLFSWSATLKTILWQGPTGAINQHIFKVLPKEGIDKTFLHYLIDNSLPALTEESHGSTMKHIKKSALSAFHLQIPPLPEQKKIAEILSGIDKLILILSKREQSIRNLLEGAISEIFSIALGVAEEMRLCDIVNPDRPITYGIVQTGEKLLEGIPCVRVADFDSGTLDPSTMIKTSHEISSQYERTILQEGDLMVALRGDIGRTEIASSALSGANLTRGVALLSKSYGINPQYLRYAMRSPSVRRQIKDGTNGSALQEIPLKNLREILIPLPSLSQQDAHAKCLESVEILMTSTLSQRRSLELCKSAVSSDLLSGRKRVSV